MPDALIEAATRRPEPTDRRFEGVAIAEVISNMDLLGQARVQLRLPWLPGVEPWARVASPSAGQSRGFFAIPQTGDEVLVAFAHGDLREPYVIGSLWNVQDQPPAMSPIDPVNKRMLKTPKGHVITLDDLEQSVKIETMSRQTVTVDPRKIECKTSSGSTITIETSGKVTIQGTASAEINAPMIKLEGNSIEIRASASLTLDGGSSCSVQAATVRIN